MANEEGQEPIIPEHIRAYIYRIVLAVMVIAVARGLIAQEEAPLWLELILGVLGLGSAGLATKNTSRKK